MTVFHEHDHASTQLETMGLTIDQLSRAVGAGLGGFTSATRFHGSAAPGTFLYHETTAGLRRQLVPQGGWDHDEEDSQPRTYSESRGIAIVVQTGDENTGIVDPEREPRARNPKGEATSRKVKRNSAQLSLFSTAAVTQPDDDAASAKTLTWVLLVHVDIENQVARAELSLPVSEENHRPCAWRHRIVLPEIPLGGGAPVAGNDSGDTGDTGDTGDVDIDVTWK